MTISPHKGDQYAVLVFCVKTELCLISHQNTRHKPTFLFEHSISGYDFLRFIQIATCSCISIGLLELPLRAEPYSNEEENGACACRQDDSDSVFWFFHFTPIHRCQSPAFPLRPRQSTAPWSRCHRMQYHDSLSTYCAFSGG